MQLAMQVALKFSLQAAQGSEEGAKMVVIAILVVVRVGGVVVGACKKQREAVAAAEVEGVKEVPKVRAPSPSMTR